MGPFFSFKTARSRWCVRICFHGLLAYVDSIREKTSWVAFMNRFVRDPQMEMNREAMRSQHPETFRNLNARCRSA
jgi:hypothetical protein